MDKKQLDNVMKQSPRGYGNIIKHQYPSFHNKIKSLDTLKTFTNNLYDWYYDVCGGECVQCGSTTSFKQFSHGYYDFCSCSCRAIHNKSHKNGLTQNAIKKRANWRISLTPEEAQTINKNRAKTNLSRYGVASLFSDPERAKRNGRQQRFKKYGKDIFAILENKTLLYNMHTTDKKTIGAIAKELGVTWESVKGAFIRHDIPVKHHGSKSSEENELYDWLVTQGVNVVQSNRNIIPPQELDLFIPELNIAIEYCGVYWHREGRVGKKYHVDKMDKCKELGIRLITVFDYEWNNSKKIVKHRLLHILNKGCDKIYARNTVFKEISNVDAKNFINQYHIQGWVASKYKFGLFHKNLLVAVMTVGKSRYDKNVDYEILRFASSCAVVGGASKLFCNIRRKLSGDTYVSYCDLRWGTGDSYHKMGFEEITRTPPSYFYWKSGKKYHRSAFMKHKIVELGGDPLLTEYENMLNMGYIRVWDCGTKKYVYGSNT